ncbi:hypothetical protein Bca52824_031277 [Brassica carinata]|uniref:MLO-like protein n=1 Tax=Brassica carinata TaxID=52824 RepID=A0A8X7V6H1_BRACI|nr:hypothetical protein Bca52824_031277 [Brassica carinata]
MVESFPRRSLASKGYDECAEKGKVAFVSSYAMHQLHIFIFVLAVCHVIYCIVTYAFGKTKMRRRKRWEEETKTIEYQYSHDSNIENPFSSSSSDAGGAHARRRRPLLSPFMLPLSLSSVFGSFIVVLDLSLPVRVSSSSVTAMVSSRCGKLAGTALSTRDSWEALHSLQFTTFHPGDSRSRCSLPLRFRSTIRIALGQVTYLLFTAVFPRICSGTTRSTTISRLLTSSGLHGDNILFNSRRCYHQRLISNRLFISKASWRQRSKLLAYSLQVLFNKICFFQGDSSDRLSTLHLHPPAIPSFAFRSRSRASFAPPEKLPSCSSASRNLNTSRSEVRTGVLPLIKSKPFTHPALH